MSSNIKGITIEIGGNTSGLKEALKEVDKSLGSTQKELKEVDKALKFDPSNVTLLTQKQTLLTSAIKDTTSRLETLKEAKKQADQSGSVDKDSKSYRELEREIETATQKLNGFENEQKNVNNALKGASTNALEFGDILKANVIGDIVTKGLETVANSVMKIASSFVDVVKSGVEYNAQMEQYTTAFTAMLGSAEEAQIAVDKIKESAAKSPFDVASLVEANQALLTTGETAEKTDKVIMALGDAVAYTGGGNDELKRMAQNLAQVKNVGKATSVDIKQFANAGINIYGVLSESLGLTVQQVQELDITYEQLSDALIKASEEEGMYFGAMDRQSGTLNGQLAIMKSNWEGLTGLIANDATSALSNDFLPAVNGALESMLNWEEEGFGSLGEAMGKGISDVISKGVEMAPDLLSSGWQMINDVVDGFLTEDENGDTALENAIESLVQWVTELVMTGDFMTKVINIGWQIGKGIIKGFWNGLVETWRNLDTSELDAIVDQYNSDMYAQNSWGGSGGYSNYNGKLASGGYSSGGVVLNANFSINNGNNINTNTVKSWTATMVDLINDELGRMM